MVNNFLTTALSLLYICYIFILTQTKVKGSKKDFKDRKRIVSFDVLFQRILHKSFSQDYRNKIFLLFTYRQMYSSFIYSFNIH